MTRITLDDWHRSGHTDLRFRGHRIYTRVQKAAGRPVLLLIHGFPTASWDWEAIWSDLAEDNTLIAADMIGFGFSDKPRDHRYCIAEQADLFEELLRSEDVTSYHCLAHDYGDTVAQELLARQSEPGARPRMISVSLLNGGLFPETHRPLLTQRLLLSPLGPLVAKQMSRSRLERSMRRIFGVRSQPSPELIDGFWELIMHNDGRAALAELIRYMEERRRYRARWVGALETASIPIQLIVGMDDPISGAHMVERYRQLIRQPMVKELAGVGHYPQVEAPDAVLKAYRSFQAYLDQAGVSPFPAEPS